LIASTRCRLRERRKGASGPSMLAAATRGARGLASRRP
jgi:hypothetical protein